MLGVVHPLAQRLDGVVGEARERASVAITGPVSTPSSTKCTVAAAAGAPAARTSSSGWAPGKSGSGAGWTLTTRCGKRSRNAGRSRCM